MPRHTHVVGAGTPELVKEGSCGYAEEERMVTGQGHLDPEPDSESPRQEE